MLLNYFAYYKNILLILKAFSTNLSHPQCCVQKATTKLPPQSSGYFFYPFFTWLHFYWDWDMSSPSLDPKNTPTHTQKGRTERWLKMQQDTPWCHYSQNWQNTTQPTGLLKGKEGEMGKGTRREAKTEVLQSHQNNLNKVMLSQWPHTNRLMNTLWNHSLTQKVY